MPALPGPPPWVSTPSGGRRRRDCSEEGLRRDEVRGDFGDFPEVGLLGPAAELGERSLREVAHKPSAINHNARGG